MGVGEFIIGCIVTISVILFSVLSFDSGKNSGMDDIEGHCKSYQKFEYNGVLYSCKIIKNNQK